MIRLTRIVSGIFIAAGAAFGIGMVVFLAVHWQFALKYVAFWVAILAAVWFVGELFTFLASLLRLWLLGSQEAARVEAIINAASKAKKSKQ